MPRDYGAMSRQGYRRGTYEDGYEDGYSDCLRESRPSPRRRSPARKRSPPKKARKLTAWNRYVKNKKNHIKMRDGKLNLKKMAVQFRKKRK